MNQMKWNRIIKHCHSLSGWQKWCWGGETSQKRWMEGSMRLPSCLDLLPAPIFMSWLPAGCIQDFTDHPGYDNSHFLGIKEWNAHQFAATSVTPQKNWPFQHVQICNPFIVQSPIITCHFTKHPLDTEMRWIPEEMIHSNSQTSVP